MIAKAESHFSKNRNSFAEELKLFLHKMVDKITTICAQLELFQVKKAFDCREHRLYMYVPLINASVCFIISY